MPFGFEYRILDVAVAVAVLLAMAMFLVRLIRQPVKRLTIIQWSLLGGLLLAFGVVWPWHRFSLGISKFGQESIAVADTTQQLRQNDLLANPNRNSRDVSDRAIQIEPDRQIIEAGDVVPVNSTFDHKWNVVEDQRSMLPEQPPAKQLIGQNG